MEAFMNVVRKYPEVRVKINDMLDRYNRLPLKNQSKLGYDTLFQNVILKELINITGSTIIDLEVELKMKISRIKYLEDRLMYNK